MGFSYSSGAPDNFTFSFMFQFKDGKVRIEAPIMPWEHTHMHLSYLNWHTKFDKDNQWKKPEQLSVIDDAINSFLNDIVKTALDTTQAW